MNTYEAHMNYNPSHFWVLNLSSIFILGKDFSLAGQFSYTPPIDSTNSLEIFVGEAPLITGTSDGKVQRGDYLFHKSGIYSVFVYITLLFDL